MGGGIGGLLNVKQSGQNYSYLYDGKGNVTAVIDSAEATAATYTYDAFGNLMVKTGSLDQPFQFSTKRYDAQTGLVYYGYRFYSPVQGRWITRDPLGEAGGMNLYGFVEGNPINNIDPFGLRKKYPSGWRPCNAEELEACEEKCGCRGMESCAVYYQEVGTITDGEPSTYTKEYPSCNCNEEDDGSNPPPLPDINPSYKPKPKGSDLLPYLPFLLILPFLLA